MLDDTMIQSFKQRPRLEVMGIIKNELVQGIIAGTLKRDYALIQERHASLEATRDENFVAEATNFIYFLQLDPRRVTPPQKPSWKKASEILPHLPYKKYDFHSIEETSMCLFYPLVNGHRAQGMEIDAGSAARLAGMLEKDLFIVAAYVMHEKKPCRVMWLQEDGQCSVNTDLRSYYVNQLEEIVK